MKNIVNILITLMFVAVVFSASFTPIRVSNDAWWHLKAGQYIVENDYHLPENDVFAHTAAEYKWDNHEWLTEVMFYKVYSYFEDRTLGGLRSVILFKALILVAAFGVVLLLVYIRTGNYAVAVFLGTLGILVAKKTIFVRPPIMSYFFLSVFLVVLHGVKFGKLKKKWLAFLPIAMIPWANMHGGFILGLLAIGFFIAGELAEVFLSKTGFGTSLSGSFQDAKSNIKILSFVFIACLATSLCTPYGYRLYVLTYRVLSDRDLVGMIPELKPPMFRYTLHYLFLALFVVAGFVVRFFVRLSGKTSVSEEKKSSILVPADFIIVLFFLHQSLSHVRHLPLFGIVASPIAGIFACDLFSAINARVKERFLKFAPIGVLVVMLLLCAYSVFFRMAGESNSFYRKNMQLYSGTEYLRDNYPAAVCDFIIDKNIRGTMFNEINFAGYLIWRLSPEHAKVFTDPRYDIFGADFIFEEAAIKSANESDDPSQDWRELFKKYQFDFVIIGRNTRLAQQLESLPGWTLAFDWINPRFHPQGYRVYVKEDAASENETDK